MSVTFPNVPFVQGVPPVLRDATAKYDAQAIIMSSAETAPAGSEDWGIFDANGLRVLVPDSFVSIEQGVEFRISDYPVEKGGFQSYNKVATPFEVRLMLSKGGSVSDRQDFLDTLGTIQASLDLYDVSTPETVYVGVNITRVSQSRSTQSGAGMANVEIMLQEVRQTVVAAFTTATADAPPALATAPAAAPVAPLAKGTTKMPASVATANQGAVQPKPVSVSGAHLNTVVGGGKQVYVYDKIVGSAR